MAWIYVGPHNDGGWSQAHDDGRLYVQKMLGSKVQTTYKENIAVGAQFDQTVASLVAQGYKMIFATSYGYLTKAFAAKYPNVLFEQATGHGDRARTSSEYFGAAEDTVFLSGMAAGAASKTGHIGFVVAYPIPEVIRHTNAFTLGAQLTHPGATVTHRLDEQLVQPGRREEGRAEPRRRGRRRARPERRLARDRSVRRVAGHPLGRLRLRLLDASRRSRG